MLQVAKYKKISDPVFSITRQAALIYKSCEKKAMLSGSIPRELLSIIPLIGMFRGQLCVSRSLFGLCFKSSCRRTEERSTLQEQFQGLPVYQHRCTLRLKTVPARSETLSPHRKSWTNTYAPAVVMSCLNRTCQAVNDRVLSMTVL